MYMSVPRRFNKPQFLSKLDVLIEDDAVISRFFNITEFPEVLTQGKSSFLIGGSQLLKIGTEVKFEIVNDDSGAVVYTEPVANYLEGTSRRVSIEIYDDNDLFGDCTLTVVGELNPSLTNVPTEFQDSYNVRYTRKVYISGAGVNTQPILFYNQPRIFVTEIVKPYITTNAPTGSILKTGTISGAPIPEDEGVTTNTQTEEQPAKFLKRKKKSLRSKLFGGGGNNSFIRKGRRRVRRSSPEADRYTFTQQSGTLFDSRMVDGTLRIVSASVASSFQLESYHVVPDLYTTPIEDVKNSTTLVPDKPFVITDTRFAESEPQREVIVPIDTSNFSVTFQAVPTQSLSTVNFRSYGDIRISRLRTFSGDIDRIKVYARNNDAFGDFEQISDQQIESPELLFNVFGAGNQSIGFFLEPATITTYWLTSSNTTATLSSNTIINAVAISGSNELLNQNLVFTQNGTYEMSFNDETEYEISFNLFGRKGPKRNISGDVKQLGRMGVFISGSSFSVNHDLGDEFGFQLETPDGTPAFFEVDEGSTQDFGNVTEVFKPNFDGKGVVKIVIFGGNFELSDLSIKPASSTGFSPNFVQVIAPVPELTSERPDNYEFIAEFYDVNNNVAETIAFASASQFAGGNNYIAGGDNLLSGSVFVGSAIGGGIEMAGVSSGLIRSIGYDGFVSASTPQLSGSSGFMFFSGSVFPNSGDNYKGVGLELFGSTGSFFRYRSDPSILEIVTDKFFVGTSGSGNPEQYISGSNGNVEISSSDFHLTRQGDVTASAILLGNKSEGQFLQFVGDQLTVQGNLSVDQIRTPATIGGVPSTNQNASSSIDQFGLATFNSASIAGFTINPVAIHSSDKSLVLSGSGQITGSTVLFTGGRIGGFSLTSNEITATDFVLNPSQKLLSLGSGNNIFIADADEGIQLGNSTFASAPFSVTRQGVLKATSGTVAGWNLSSDTLEGGDLILEKTGTIRSRGYQSDVAGSGFILTAASGGFLEVENAKIRGTLSTATFEKESVNAVGGQLYVANSTTLTSSVFSPDGNHSLTQRTMSVVNSTGFVAGEIITAKKVSNTGFQTEYMLIESSSRAGSDDTDLSGFLFVQRGYGAGTTGASGSLGDIPSAAQGYSGSQVIVSTGKQGTGYIRLNANPNDQATPYMDIVERTGTGLYDVELKARLGDLSGVAGSRNVPLGFTGFGLMSEVAFLSGSMIKLEAPTFLLGDKNQNFVSGALGNMEISSSNFHLKRDGQLIFGSKSTNQFVEWNNTNLVVRGDLSVDSLFLPATIAGAASNATNASSSLDSQGLLKTVSASIGGWKVDATTISGGVVTLNSAGSIEVGGLSDATTTGTTNSGFFADSSGNVLIKGNVSNNDYLKVSSGGGIDIRSQTFDLDAGSLIMDSAGDSGNGVIRLGGSGGPSTPTEDVQGIYMDGGGALNVFGNATNFFRIDGGSFTIKSDNFDLDAGSIILDSAGSGKVALGGSPPTAFDSGVGFYADGTGKFLAGNSTGSRIQYDGSNLTLSSSAFLLGNSGSAYISASLGNLEMSSSNFFLKGDGSLNIGMSVSGSGSLMTPANLIATSGAPGTFGSYYQKADTTGLDIHLKFDQVGTLDDGDTLSDAINEYDFDFLDSSTTGQAVFEEGAVGNAFKQGHSSVLKSGYDIFDSIVDTTETTISVSCWIKPDTISSSTTRIVWGITGNPSGTAANWGLQLSFNYANFKFDVWDDNAADDNDRATATLNLASKISTSEFTHITCVYEGGQAIRIYAENSFGTTHFAATNIQSKTDLNGIYSLHGGRVFIGALYGDTRFSSGWALQQDTTPSFSFPFNGHIDDWRFYEKVMTQADSQALYNLAQQRTKPKVTALKFSDVGFDLFTDNLQISSSGDVTMTGEVKAGSGNIGGFTIGNGALTGGTIPGLDAVLQTSGSGTRVKIDGATNMLSFFQKVSGQSENEIVRISDGLSTYVTGAPGTSDATNHFGTAMGTYANYEFAGIAMRRGGSIRLDGITPTGGSKTFYIGLSLNTPFSTQNGSPSISDGEHSGSYIGLGTTYPGPVSIVNATHGSTMFTYAIFKQSKGSLYGQYLDYAMDGGSSVGAGTNLSDGDGKSSMTGLYMLGRHTGQSGDDSMGLWRGMDVRTLSSADAVVRGFQGVAIGDPSTSRTGIVGERGNRWNTTGHGNSIVGVDIDLDHSVLGNASLGDGVGDVINSYGVKVHNVRNTKATNVVGEPHGLYVESLKNYISGSTYIGGTLGGGSNTLTAQTDLILAAGLQRPYEDAFLVKATSDQLNLTVGSNNTVEFQTEVYDVGGNFSSNVFTAPSNGKYVFFARLRVKKDNLSSSKHYTLKFVTDAGTYDTEQVPGNATTGLGMQGMIIAHMDANDTCEVQILPQTGASAGADIKGDTNLKTYFGGYKIG